MASPTKPQNGCEKIIEYYHLNAATLAREGQQVSVAAIYTIHTGKAVVPIAAIEIAVDYLLDIGPSEALSPHMWADLIGCPPR
ncbi:MAG: hypothetical protein ABIL68_11985 [bacterium]